MQPPSSSLEETESTDSLFEEQDRQYKEPGKLFAPCRHRRRNASRENFTTPCYWCVKEDRHRFLRTTSPLLLDENIRRSPACEHRSPGYLLPCSSCTNKDYMTYVRRVNPLLAQSLQDKADRAPPTGYTRYEDLVEAAQKEGGIFRRQPTPITWCTSCRAMRCKEGCERYEEEASALRGETPKAASVEEKYSSSETIRADKKEILYSPALTLKMKNKANQTRRPYVHDKATQTEAEAIPLRNPSRPGRITRLLLFLAAASLILSWIAAIPTAAARPLSTGEHFPSTAVDLFRSLVSVSLIVVASKFLATHASATVTSIPELPEPTAAAATAFVAAIAMGYLLVRRPRPDTEESLEVVDEAVRANENWEPFLRDISAPEFAEWKTELISDRHNKNTLRNAIFALYARLQASLDLGKRQGEFITFLNDNPPWRDVLVRLSAAVGKEEGDWTGAIEKAERWCKYAEDLQQRVWPLFPNVPENERTVNRLYQQIDELYRLRHTVVRNAAGYTLAHGLPVDTERIEDLQHWVNAAPREFEKEVATLLKLQSSDREEILSRIRGFASAEKGECSRPQELAARMRNEITTTWEESLRGIANLQALAPTIVVTWSAILKHFASLVKPGGSEEELKKDNAALQEKLDDALIRLELLKGTNGGGPQKYTVPLFDTCFTDVCSWNTWRNQALAWAKENLMVLGTPANALSWFSRLLSGRAHDYVVSKIGEILGETQTIHEAVQAAAGLLDTFFADPDAETRAIERFWKTLQGNRRFGLFYMDWQAARAALPEDAVSKTEQTRAFIRALRPGLKNKLETHFLAQGVARPTIEQYASFAPMLDRNCGDTACIPNTCNSDRQEFTCPGGKGYDCRCKEKNSSNQRRDERKRSEKKEGATKRCCGAPADWLGHYRNYKYNYGNVNDRQKPTREYAQKQLHAVWICFIKETGVQDPLTAVNLIETTSFRVRVSAADPTHMSHERIRSRELFERDLSAVKQYRGSEEGWIQWCRETGVCADCWGIRNLNKFRHFVEASGGNPNPTPSTSLLSN